MPPLFRYAWSKLRDAKATKYALLVFTPIFVKPLDFIPLRSEKRPLHVRLKGLWSLPLVVGGVWAGLVSSIVEWGYGKTADPSAPLADALQHLSRIKMIGEPFVIAISVAGLYGISMLRWGYHCAAIKLLRKWWPGLTKPHLLYFLVNTSSWGLWAAIYGAGLFHTIKWWDKAGQPAFVPDDNNLTQPFAVLLVLIVLGGLQHFTTRNSVEGMRALYGGHRALRFVVELCGVLILLIASYGLLKLA
ncbi:hypothetical protein [Pseudomonas batumici]|uniref:hypothetical protein n=1 Tax=Pseudomonas batumici TaxID=226910 RepID=UPI000589D82B|nr:hypothetical protein [Pseudomonas batumici]